MRRAGDFFRSPLCPDWMWVLGAYCLGVKQLGLDTDHLQLILNPHMSLLACIWTVLLLTVYLIFMEKLVLEEKCFDVIKRKDFCDEIC